VAKGATAGHLAGAAGEGGEGGLVVVRDERGVLSVMHCLGQDLVLDPGFQQAYRAECAALAAVSEPRLAEPLSYIMDAAGRIVASVRRYFPGVALADLIGRARGLDAQVSATVVSDVLVALDALHRRGVAHRRLDASQVIVTRGGQCVVTGAGLAVRPDGDDPGAAMAFDLAAVPELFSACLGSGRLHGVTQSIHTALTEARHAPVDRWEQGGVAAEMLAALESEAGQFGSGWRERGHDRLAAGARSVRAPRAIRSNRNGYWPPTALITRATTPQAATQPSDIPVDADGRRALRRGMLLRPGWRRIVAIGVPLLALLLLAAALRSALSSPPPQTPPPPSLAVVTGAQAPPASAVPGAVAGSATPTVSPSPSPQLTAVAVSATTTPAAGTRITSVSITSLGFTAAAYLTATVVVDTRTSGEATIEVAVTIAETGPDGPTSRTDRFTFSGQHQYTLSDNFRAMPCTWRSGSRQVVATVNVSATVPSTTASAVTTSGKLYSVPC
jgi:serine/threonine protein kinase